MQVAFTGSLFTCSIVHGFHIEFAGWQVCLFAVIHQHRGPLRQPGAETYPIRPSAGSQQEKVTCKYGAANEASSAGRHQRLPLPANTLALKQSRTLVY
jgi:hypothetical protein